MSQHISRPPSAPPSPAPPAESNSRSGGGGGWFASFGFPFASATAASASVATTTVDGVAGATLSGPLSPRRLFPFEQPPPASSTLHSRMHSRSASISATGGAVFDQQQQQQQLGQLYSSPPPVLDSPVTPLNAFAHALAATRSAAGASVQAQLSPRRQQHSHSPAPTNAHFASAPPHRRTLSSSSGNGSIPQRLQLPEWRSADNTPLPSPALQHRAVSAAPGGYGESSGAAAASAAAVSAAAASSADAVATSRLPPRVPPAASLWRVGSAGQSAWPGRVVPPNSNSNPSTPHVRTPSSSTLSQGAYAQHMAPQQPLLQQRSQSAAPAPKAGGASGAGAGTAAGALPSLNDLVSPDDSALPFASWSTLGASGVAVFPSAAGAAGSLRGSRTQPSTPMGGHDGRILQPHPFHAAQPAQLHAHSRSHVSENGVPDDSEVGPEWRALLARAESIEHVRADPAVHALVARGVPAAVRPRLWMLLSGANEDRRRHPADYYQQLLARHRAVGSVFDDEIRRDLARTLPGLPLFDPRAQPEDYDAELSSVHAPGPIVQPTGRGGLHQLHRVLAAYATRNPQVGFCQGMSMIAGALLYVLGSEEDSFWVLCALVEARLGYYCKSMIGLEIDQRVLASLVAYHLPALADHLRACDVMLASFTVSWFVCLGVEAPLGFLDEVCLLWDRLFLGGDEVLFAFALAVLRRRTPAILRKRDGGELMEFLLSGFKTRPSNGPARPHHPSPHAGTGAGGGGEGGGWMDVGHILAHDVPRLGPLSKQIAALRDLHRNAVLAKSRTLHSHVAARLAAQFKFDSPAAVQRQWEAFLAPAPYAVLLHSCITTPVVFLESFCAHVFPSSVVAAWRDGGLLSGLVERIFAVVDADRRDEVTFEAFLAAVHVFRQGDEEERCRFAFRTFDLDYDGRIGRRELAAGLRLFDRSFHGHTLTDAGMGAGAGVGSWAGTQVSGDGSLAAPEPVHTPSPSPASAAADGDFGAASTPSGPGASADTGAHADTVAADEEGDMSELFARTMFLKAAEIHRAGMLAEAERAASAGEKAAGPGSLAAAAAAIAAAVARVPSLAEVHASLLSRGLNYTLFRRVIPLHPLTRLTFQLHLAHDARAFGGAATHTPTTGTKGATVPAAATAAVAALPPAALPQQQQQQQLSNGSDGASTPASASVPITPAQPAQLALAPSGAASVGALSAGAGGSAAVSVLSAGATSASSSSLLSALDRSIVAPAVAASQGVGSSGGGAAGVGGNGVRSRSGSLHLAMSTVAAPMLPPVATVAAVLPLTISQPLQQSQSQ